MKYKKDDNEIVTVYFEPQNIQFEHLLLDGSFSETEIDAITTISNSLKSKLIESPYYNVVLTEDSKIIHGKISKSGSFYYLVVNLTDFEKQVEISTADYKFLSLVDFDFAVNQIVSKLEGHEITFSENDTIPILNEEEILVPELLVDKDDKLQQMYNLFSQELAIGNRALIEKDYQTSVYVFSSFQKKFNYLLTNDYKEKLNELYLFSIEQENTAKDFILIETIKNDRQMIDKLQKENDFEGIWYKYDDYITEINSRNRKESALIREYYNHLVDIRNQYKKICESIIHEKEKEFNFNLNYYAFQYDDTGVQNSFSEYISYAAKSHYWKDVKESFFENFNFYRSRFELSVTKDDYYQALKTSQSFRDEEKLVISRYRLVEIPPGYTISINKQWCDSFYIGKYELTEKEFTVLSNNNSPITNISWVQAAEYCNMLNERIGLLPYYNISDNGIVINSENGGFHLPTLLQWRMAAYDMNGTPRESNFSVNGYELKVGLFPPNEFGIYDLFESEIEYCSDISNDGKCPAIGDRTNTEVRESWTNRFWVYDPFVKNDVGLRLAYDSIQ